MILLPVTLLKAIAMRTTPPEGGAKLCRSQSVNGIQEVGGSTPVGSVYYYGRRVPVHLVEIIGKTFIQFSLDTTSLKEAKTGTCLPSWPSARQSGPQYCIRSISSP
jgi:hypothetical protein